MSKESLLNEHEKHLSEVDEEAKKMIKKYKGKGDQKWKIFIENYEKFDEMLNQCKSSRSYNVDQFAYEFLFIGWKKLSGTYFGSYKLSGNTKVPEGFGTFYMKKEDDYHDDRNNYLGEVLGPKFLGNWENGKLNGIGRWSTRSDKHCSVSTGMIVNNKPDGIDVGIRDGEYSVCYFKNGKKDQSIKPNYFVFKNYKKEWVEYFIEN